LTADNPYLTFTDAGKIAGVSRSTIARWVLLGELPCVSMPASGRRRIRKQTLLDFLDSLESQPQETHRTQVSQVSKKSVANED
jgi:excisionase family DNA binding protein